MAKNEDRPNNLNPIQPAPVTPRTPLPVPHATPPRMDESTGERKSYDPTGHGARPPVGPIDLFDDNPPPKPKPDSTKG